MKCVCIALSILICSVGLILARAPTHLLAAELYPRPLDNAEIRDLVAGNSVTGRRSGEGFFEEFYRDDGLLLGIGYQARWHATENQLCIEDYPNFLGTRENEWDCYSLLRTGDKLRWLDTGGQLDGQGQILPGNAFGY